MRSHIALPSGATVAMMRPPRAALTTALAARMAGVGSLGLVIVVVAPDEKGEKL